MKAKSAVLAAVVAGAVLVVVLIVPAGDSSPKRPARMTDSKAGAHTRGCRERVEGGKIVPNRAVDTVIGPMAFIRLPHVYRDYASRSNSELLAHPEAGMPAMKSTGCYGTGSASPSWYPAVSAAG